MRDEFLEYEYYDDVAVIRETGAALLCLIDGEDYWIPKSVMGSDSDVTGSGHCGTLSVERWFAEQNIG